MNRLVVAASTWAVLVLACGGRTLDSTDGGGYVDSGSSDGDALGEGGWTACSSPDGYMVCGGANDCNAGTECAKACLGDELEPCTPSSIDDNFGTCDQPPCPDGYECLLTDRVSPTDSPLFGECVLDQVATLFHLNGQDSRLLYSDFSIYDGTPLPSPSTCPTIASLTLCGGACGDNCGKYTGAGTSACFGRSPKHPYSICAPIGPACTRTDQTACTQWAGWGHGAQGCVIFEDDTASQANADAHGVCIPQVICQAAASGYPGGGVTCVVP